MTTIERLKDAGFNYTMALHYRHIVLTGSRRQCAAIQAKLMEIHYLKQAARQMVFLHADYRVLDQLDEYDKRFGEGVQDMLNRISDLLHKKINRNNPALLQAQYMLFETSYSIVMRQTSNISFQTL